MAKIRGESEKIDENDIAEMLEPQQLNKPKVL